MSSTIGIEVPVGWVVDEFCIDGARQTPIDPSQPTPPDEEYRVNGPGCDPATANATLQFDDTGVVTVRHR